MDVRTVLEEAISARVFPGCAYAYGTPDKTETGFLGSFTYDKDSPKVQEDTLWDLASLTKVTATTSVALIMSQRGELDIDSHVTAHLPRFRHDQVTLRDLLRHRSGLPAYEAFQTKCRTVAECEDRLYSLPLRPAKPPVTEYSCLGFMTLQRVLERVSGHRLDRLFKEMVGEPLGMKSAQYCPPLPIRDRCAPTEAIPAWLREISALRGTSIPVGQTYIQGEVHDPAAWMMGGVSGNAGLFGSIQDMSAFAQELCRGGGQVFDPTELTLWRSQAAPDSTRALGFDTKGSEPSRGGPDWIASTFGHTGYTGTSIWVSPSPAFFAVLLTNRVHPDDSQSRISEVRTAYGEAVWRAILG